jgi:hypothetical protein
MRVGGVDLLPLLLGFTLSNLPLGLELGQSLGVVLGGGELVGTRGLLDRGRGGLQGRLLFPFPLAPFLGETLANLSVQFILGEGLGFLILRLGGFNDIRNSRGFLIRHGDNRFVLINFQVRIPSYGIARSNGPVHIIYTGNQGTLSTICLTAASRPQVYYSRIQAKGYGEATAAI